MNTPLEITFKGLDKSEAIEAKIKEKAQKLEKHFDRITHCRVVVSAPNKHSHKGKTYEIKIDIGIPEHAPIIVTHDSAVGNATEDLQIAIRDAFAAAQRHLDETVEKMRRTARTEHARRKPAPTVE